MTPLRVFIGYDHRETIALHVLQHSIMARATRPISITPVMQQTLRSSGFYDRERGPTESTDFSLTRFLVPFLSGYTGVSIFMDCDMLCLADITDLEFEIERARILGVEHAVWVCQHNYTPKSATKFLGQQQTTYPRKNWSSLMVFDNARCKVLTPDHVSRASGLELHRFQWVQDADIGSLPLTWNWLVDEYDPNPFAHILHYTNGGPWFLETANCDHADEWFAEQAVMLSPLPVAVSVVR